MKTAVSFTSLGLLALVLGAGCGESPKASSTAAKAPAKKSAEKHDEHGHAHPSKGPHGGPLIELGKEEYHAELVHDEKAGSVTIYVLDHEGKKPVAIDAKEVRINLKHDGKGEQFELTAEPQKGEDGKSSRFVSTDKELSEDLDHEGAEARLVLSIDGKSYTGQIKHEDDHDHEEGHKK